MTGNFTLHLAGSKRVSGRRTLVMGILNATPDSFSDGGEIDNQSALETRIESMLYTGADILDVGGESTRPGHKKVDAEEELGRVLPVIKKIRAISNTIPISIDTQKASVAHAALKAGASLINDVSALSDEHMPGVISTFGCSIILMRNKDAGADVVAGCREQFKEITVRAEGRGVERSRILLDPGLGFGDLAGGDYTVSPGSNPKANLSLITNIEKYSLGLPVVIGASRKRFIGDLTGVKKANGRLGGSLAAAILAKQAGAAIVRVHDVNETVQAFKLLDA
jgi:dihydropteroate synthase